MGRRRVFSESIHLLGSMDCAHLSCCSGMGFRSAEQIPAIRSESANPACSTTQTAVFALVVRKRSQFCDSGFDPLHSSFNTSDIAVSFKQDIVFGHDVVPNFN